MNFDHSIFISPFSWRYGSDSMRRIWSEVHKRHLMRQVWVAIAEVQNEAGLVNDEQLADLVMQQDNVDIERSISIEKETRHDVMAEIKTFAEQCAIGGSIIHWGATSADITDNVDVMRSREALMLVEGRLKGLLIGFVKRIQETAGLPILALTHIQPAEPSTLGYRFAVYAQDLFEDWQRLSSLRKSLRGKGLKGAVGTQASFEDILESTGMTSQSMEKRVMEILELPYYPIATQTYTRQQDLHLFQVLAGIAASLHKFALDFRILQSPFFGEWSEPFGKSQVGSSAMPFKRNPINTENICSLARYVASLPGIAWDNASQAILERSLDDSANRRLMFAEGFLATDELLRRTATIISDMQINEVAISKNLAVYGPFAATERVLMSLVAKGVDRQDGHEWLRELSIQAWERIQNGFENPLVELIKKDDRICSYLSQAEVTALMDVSRHSGSAQSRAREFANMLKNRLQTDEIPIL